MPPGRWARAFNGYGLRTNGGSQMTFADLIAQFGTTAKDKLDGPGEREALLSGPVARLIEDLGAESGMKTVAHDEVREQDGSVRPDFGVRVNDVLVGHIELNAPGVSLDPESYGKTTHNYRQWQRLKELPNLLHTNGVEWRLWRYGELVDEPVSLHTPSLTRTRGKLTAPSRMEMLLNGFLRWEPAPISSVSKLVDTLAPLARMLREEVRLPSRQSGEQSKLAQILTYNRSSASLETGAHCCSRTPETRSSQTASHRRWSSLWCSLSVTGSTSVLERCTMSPASSKATTA